MDPRACQGGVSEHLDESNDEDTVVETQAEEAVKSGVKPIDDKHWWPSCGHG